LFDILKGGALFLVLFCVGQGALGSHWNRAEEPRPSTRETQAPAVKPTPPPGPPQDLTKSETYEQLEALLDARLEQHRRESAEWTRLLESADETKQRSVVARLRSKLLDLLHPWPGPKTDLQPQLEPWFSQDGVDVSLVRLQTHDSLSLQCALMILRKPAGPRPALLVLHGYDGNLQSVVADIDYHHGFGMKLAQRGYIVLAPLRVTASVATNSKLKIKSMAGGWTLEAINLWQLVRAVDYLSTLDQVDRGHIGVYGISYGGQHALRLSALDQRLSLTICSGYFTDRFTWLFKNRIPMQPAKHIGILPEMGVLFDDLNLVALIQPRFFGVESGARDPRHRMAQEEFAKVCQLYDHIKRPDRAQFMAFNGGHETSVDNVASFLEHWVATPPPNEAWAP